MRSIVKKFNSALRAISTLKTSYFCISAVSFIVVILLIHHQHSLLAIVLVVLLSYLYANGKSHAKTKRTDIVKDLTYAIQWNKRWEKTYRENTESLFSLVRHVLIDVQRIQASQQKPHLVLSCLRRMSDAIPYHTHLASNLLPLHEHYMLYRLIDVGFTHYFTHLDAAEKGLRELHISVVRARGSDTEWVVFPLVLAIINSVAKDNHIMLIGEDEGKPQQEVVC